MALPTIIINNGTGSNTAASGAGPATAITGTVAASSVTAQPVIGFFEGSDPDLSGIVSTGAHALYIQQSSTRKFSKILGVNNTATTTATGGATNASSTVTAAVTTGLAAGDLVKVTDGTTTLYSRISTVTANTSIILFDNWTGSNGTVTITRPKNVTVEDSFSAQIGKTWAIGGKRFDFETTNSDTKQAFSDMHGGWTFDIQGTTYTVTSKIVIAASDISTSSLVTITSTNAAASAPTITTATASTYLLSIEPLVTGNGNLFISNINFTNTWATGTTKAALIATGANNISSNQLYIQDCLFDINATTGAVSAIDFISRGAGYTSIKRCTIRNFMGYGIASMGGVTYGNMFLGSTGCAGGIWITSANSLLGTPCIKNSFNNCTVGILCNDTGHASGNFSAYDNSFRGGTTGISMAMGATTGHVFTIINNAFWNMTTGINIATGNTAQQYTYSGAYGNAFGSVTTTITASTIPVYSAGPTIIADPWPSAASGDFRAATGSVLQSAGYPLTPVGYPSIINGDDIGSMGHVSAGGGGGTKVFAMAG